PRSSGRNTARSVASAAAGPCSLPCARSAPLRIAPRLSAPYVATGTQTPSSPEARQLPLRSIAVPSSLHLVIIVVKRHPVAIRVFSIPQGLPRLCLLLRIHYLLQFGAIVVVVSHACVYLH